MRRPRHVLLAILIAALAIPLASAAMTQTFLTSTSTGSSSPFGQFNGLSIALADFTGSGHLQVVAQNDNGNAYVIDPVRGKVLATLAPGNAGCTTACYDFEGVSGPINAPAVGDLDSTGRLSVVLADTANVVARFTFDPTHSTNDSYAFTKTWERRFNDYGAWTNDAGPVLADLSGDGKLDILISTEENGVFAVKPDGSLLWSKNMPGGHATPGARDIDGDGKVEAIIPRDDGIVSVLDGATGNEKWSVSAADYGIAPGSIPAAALLSDVNGDGLPDVVFTARDAHDAIDFSNDHFAMFAFDSWGNFLWEFQPSWGAPMSHTRSVLVSVGGVPAILGADWNTIGHKPGNFERVGPGHAFLVDAATGAEIWHTDLDSFTQSNKDLIVADAVGDGSQQVLIEGQRDGVEGLLALDLATGTQKGFFSTAPYAITRGDPAAGDLFGDGTFALVVPVAQGDAGALDIFHGPQALDAAFPGWGALHPPRGTNSAPSGATFAASFAPKGNEWWIETAVKSASPIASVQVALNGGAATTLPRTWWGTWAKSIHAVAGTIAQFTASDASGATATSGCYQWTAAAPVACGSTSTPPPMPPPTSSGLVATFTPMNGNDWWIQAGVTADKPLAGVDARVDAGTWIPLTHYSYGWARSIHAPAGSGVDFRARATDGSTAQSVVFVWPR